MKSLTQHVREAAARGPVILLGGHYSYPGWPTPFALASAAHVAALTAGAPRRAPVQARMFLDDIAASEACSAVGCALPRPAGSSPSKQEMPVTSAWLAEHMSEVEAIALAREPGSHHGLAGEFAAVVRGELGAQVPLLGAAAAQTVPPALPEWLLAVEALSYAGDRNLFRPLSLTHQLGVSLPQVLFERSMVNAASRSLHKLRKSGKAEALHVSESEDLRIYTVDAFEGDRRIELRHEAMLDGQFLSAANKCAALMSQLFFYAAKQARGGGRADVVSVVYLIPCYDRTRLHDGVIAFARLYSDTVRWFGVSAVDITVAFYADEGRESVVCDCFRVTSPQQLSHRTTRCPVISDVSPRPAISARRVYADNNATTQVDPYVLAKMMPFFTHAFGNPSSAHHLGWEAEIAVAEARSEVARLIGANDDEIFFTSGATEANNWAIGAAARLADTVISSPIEHKSVLEPLARAELQGTNVIRARLSRSGELDYAFLEQVAAPEGSWVSLMTVNNEVHSVLDLERVGDICRRRGFFFHTDAAQALTTTDIDVHTLGIHALSLSGHKIYGPKGIGALFLDRGQHARFGAQVVGGGQQSNMRAGTLPAGLIVALGEACRLAGERLDAEVGRLRMLSQRFLRELERRGVSHRLVGMPLDRRCPGGLCLQIDGLDATRLCEWIPDISVSQGSACNSRGVGSHVLVALGLGLEDAKGVVRLAFGRFNTEDDAVHVAQRIAGARTAMRSVKHVVPEPLSAVAPAV